eukprot:UN04620
MQKPGTLLLPSIGDLEGFGLWELFTSENDTTIIKFTWKVKLRKTWMILIAPIARPLFVWNHRAVMNHGRIALSDKLEISVENFVE